MIASTGKVLFVLAAGLLAMPLSAPAVQEGQPPRQVRPGERAAQRADGERPPVRGAMLREKLRTRLESARALVAKLEETQALVDKNADALEVERSLEQAGRLARQAGEAFRSGTGGGNIDGPRTPGDVIFDGSASMGLEPLGASLNGKILSPEELTKAVALFERVAPDSLATLRERTKGRETLFHRMASVVTPRVRALAALTDQSTDKNSPMLALRREELESTLELMHAARMAAEPVKEGDDTQAERRQRQRVLRETLGRNFDVRTRLQSQQIDELSTRTQRMRDELRRLGQQREKLIDEKTASLLKSASRPAKEIKAAPQDGAREDRKPK